MNERIKRPESPPADPAMETFYKTLKDLNMDALWRDPLPERSTGEPKPPYPPCRWRWSDIAPVMKRAGELVTPGPEAERRVVRLMHPAISQMRAASHTLTANVQMVMPGEIAPSHRHTTHAIRFIIQGEAAISVVDGEPVTMRPGDLVLTPGWLWHGHLNESSGPMLWMDTLDRPLTAALRQVVSDQYPDALQRPNRIPGDSFARYGTGYLRPMGAREDMPYSPLLSYPWVETEKALHRLAATEADPFDDVAFFYTNPLTGGHVLPTIGCQIQMIRKGVHTRAHRQSSTGLFHVFRGKGAVIVDGVRIDYAQGDFFCLPAHCWHEHLNDTNEDAILFATTDMPVLQALHFYREDRYAENGGHQKIVGTYEDKIAAKP